MSVGLAIAFYMASKLIAVAILSSSIEPGFWFLSECVVLFAIRAAFGNWRWYLRCS